MAPRERKRLDRLDISKVSGVDHPAHLVEGYAVLKAAADGDEQALAVLAAADDIASSIDELADALTKAEVVAQLPADQQQAAADLIATVIDAVEKAELTGAQMDDLPDSSFAYVEPGGTKDADGKTTPRSKRHFPIKTAAGQPDKAHIRNALGRLDQSPHGDKARSAVEAAAKAAGIGKTAKAAPTISDERLQLLKDAHKTLGDALADNDPEGTRMPEENEELAKANARIAELEAEVAKAKEPKVDPEKSEIEKALEGSPVLKAAWDAQQADIKKARDDAEEATRIAKAEHDARVDSEYLAKARSLELPDSAKVAKALRLADEAGPEVSEFVKSLLIQRGELEQNARVLKVLGADGERDDLDPQAELDRLAKARADETGETFEKASAFVQDTPQGRELRKAIAKSRDRKAS